MKRILVGIKRVVDYNVRVRVKPDGTGVVTDGVKMSINPFDEIALEEALRIKERGGAQEVLALSVGPSDSQQQLRTALAMGADRALLVDVGQAAATLEPLATAQIFLKVVEREQPFMVIVGKQAIDDDNSQTGPMLAALWQRPQATFASKITIEGDKATVMREVDAGLETIEVESGRLDRLVGDLLDLSRLEAGAAAPAPELWSVDDLVRDAVASLHAQDHVDVVHSAHPYVDVDAVQIQRVLANLIENALKFSPPGTRVQVRVNATRAEAIVRVVDQGPGLPPDQLDRVFSAFYRGPGATSAAGAGLGLAIARGFAEANGGRVWAESRPGQGATFALALPVAEVPAELPA